MSGGVSGGLSGPGGSIDVGGEAGRGRGERGWGRVGAGDVLEGVGGWAPGTQADGVEGHVVRWHDESGAENIPAQEYIRLLEGEVLSLRNRLRSTTLEAVDLSGNTILDYLKRLDVGTVQELTENAGEEVVAAIECFTTRLLGEEAKAGRLGLPSQSTAVELAQLLFWLMVVGYNLRSLEIKHDLSGVDDSSAGGGGGRLLPGSP